MTLLTKLADRIMVRHAATCSSCTQTRDCVRIATTDAPTLLCARCLSELLSALNRATMDHVKGRRYMDVGAE